MARVPDKIKNKSAENAQVTLFLIGVLCGVGSYFAFDSGNGESGFWMALICAGLLFIASKIKTTKDFKGGLYK